MSARRGLASVLLLAAAAAVAAGLLAGIKPLSWPEVWNGAGVDGEIFWRLRLPRVCLGFLAGGALAAGGLAYQAMFRNPLATPFTLGISSGASFGTALYIKLGLSLGWGGLPGQSLAAFLGASLTAALVYGLTRARRGFSTTVLLLAGVAVSFCLTSLILFLQYMGDLTTSFRIGRWLMGGLETVGFAPVLQVLPFAAAGIAVVLALHRELDLLALGEDIAAARGVAVSRAKKLLFLAVSLMVGGTVAACGPIGFVGLIVPQAGRLLIGPRHGPLALFSVLGGGAFLVLCDVAARTVIAPAEIPAGVVTALLGGPFFLALLLRGHPGAPEA